MKANEIKDSEEFEQGIRWQVDTIEHVIITMKEWRKQHEQ